VKIQRQRDTFAFQGGELYSAKEGNKVVGQLLVVSRRGERYIGDLWTHPHYRRMGIATSLWRSAGCPAQTPGYETREGKAWHRSVGGREIRLTTSDLESLRDQGLTLRSF
jgi:hypothetical protein